MNERNEDFDEMLDSCYDEAEMFGQTFSPSDILFNCDPIAYRVYSGNWESEREEEEEE
jgi:hypothetical protein